MAAGTTTEKRIYDLTGDGVWVEDMAVNGTYGGCDGQARHTQFRMRCAMQSEDS